MVSLTLDGTCHVVVVIDDDEVVNFGHLKLSVYPS
jgi:hypothetical protein